MYLVGAAQPVEWSFYAKKITQSDYEIHLTATIDNGWILYSQFSDKGGPAPTIISTMPGKNLKFSKIFEERGTLMNRKIAGQNTRVKYFEQQVDFVQVVSLKGSQKENVQGSIAFVSSNGVQTNPPFTVNFSIPLN